MGTPGQRVNDMKNCFREKNGYLAVAIMICLFSDVQTDKTLFAHDAKETESSPQRASPLPVELSRFQPPTDQSKGASPFIHAVSARPMGILTFPQYAVDNNPQSSWSSKDKDQWITFHLSGPTRVDEICITFSTKGEVRFHIDTSLDGLRWEEVYRGESGNATGEKHTYDLRPTTARYVRVTPQRESRWGKEYWKSISEITIGTLEFRPSLQMQWWSRTWTSTLPTDDYLKQHKPVPRGSYTEVAKQTLATLIEQGTDRYGKTHSPIWVLNLDLETLNCFPRYNDELESSAASWLAPYGLGQRAIRPGQRSPGSSNLYVDQPMIRAAVLHDLLAGEKTFTPAVEAYVRSYCQRFFNEKTGLVDWGVHISQNVFSEDIQHDGGSNGQTHELIGAILPQWPTLHQMQPKAFGSEMRQFWHWHTDERTGEICRHSNSLPKGHGLAFASAAGEIILCCAYQHTQSPEGPWLGRALRIAHYHWDRRNKATNLFVNVPGHDERRFDNKFADTTIPGLWASRVLMAGRLTNNQELIDMARKTLLAWAQYGWDEKARMPWASLALDGTPHDGRRNDSGISYDKFVPIGHLALWKDYVYGFESPFTTLLTYAMAADELNDQQLKAHAVRLAGCYRRHLPANGKYGTMAGNYGQLISCLLQMERLTADTHYRELARQVAEEALDHLWTGKLIRGFAGRTHYSAIEGQGYLVQALLELDADPSTLAKLRHTNIFLWNF